MKRSSFPWLVLFAMLVTLQIGLIVHEIDHGLDDDDIACVKCLSSAHFGHTISSASISELPERSTTRVTGAVVRFFIQASGFLPSIRAPPAIF